MTKILHHLVTVVIDINVALVFIILNEAHSTLIKL